MRITNQMMVNSTMANIQVNKKQVNTLETQLSTQKKINKPSEDPVIAIRALRLRSSLEQVTQYLNKNIPDADSWLKTTEGAVDEAVSVITDLYAYCEQGATDSYSPSERSTLAESLNKLRDAYYAEGDVEYAGRYLFSGYMTDTPLTYQSDETAAKADFTITQEFTRENIELKTVYTNAYSNDDIAAINEIVDKVIKEKLNNNMPTREKIKIIHDYIIDNAEYDKLKYENKNDTTYKSNTAYGVLVQGYGTCNGYADAMAIFLDKLNIINYKISNSEHIWNLVYLDGKWYHLDLTWDDPISDVNINRDTYFLITTSELEELNDGTHKFDKSIYTEAK